MTQLSQLVRTRKVKSVELTDMYLARLARFDPQLHCVITLTEERARRQAKAADEEIASGKYRGPLHGIPWGAKDLLATKGYLTTWGAGPYKTQTIDTDATVVQRLDLSRKQAAEAYTLADQHETNPRSVWGYVQGLTRLSQHTPWQDGRFALDQAASRLLATVH